MNSEIKKMWNVFSVDEKSVLELRALAPNKPATVRHFNAAQLGSTENLKANFEETALRLNEQGSNIYVVMNPIMSTFSGHSVSDADIKCRELMLVDIDRSGDTAGPANEREVQAAQNLAGEIIAYLDGLGWPEPKQVMSGNGWHIYYPLAKLDNDDETKHCVKNTLKHLAERFNNDTVKIDTTVYNASRITKVPGTIMRKGKNASGRPYRMAVVHE